MPRFYGVKDLGSIADWQANANPSHWVRGHSAYELAHSWAGCAGFPARVTAALQPLSRELSPQYGIVEMPTFLDTPKAPSRTDIMLYCRTAADEPAIIGIEGKSAERFDRPLNVWVRVGGTEPTPSRSRRLRFLSELLGAQIPPDSSFGYQLVHRAAATVSECLVRGAAFGIVLIQSFSSATPENWSDFQAFTRLLGVTDIQKDILSDPVLLGPRHDMKMFFAWVSDEPTKAA
jgi:hypothetical protein